MVRPSNQPVGSALYTPQALWSMARQHCTVITAWIKNDAFAILREEPGQHLIEASAPRSYTEA